MPWTEIALWCGWLGCAFSAAFTVPQVLRLIRATSPADGISLRPWQAILASNVSWTIYAAMTHQAPMLVSYGLSAVFAAYIVARITHMSGNKWKRNLAIPTAVGLCMLVFVGIPVAFGIITITPALIGWIIQFIRICRGGRPPDLSFASLVLYLLCLCTWLSYALLHGDIALGASSIPLIIVITSNIVAYLASPRPSQNRSIPI